MESHEVIKEAFENKDGAGPKEIASEMGLSLSLVYKWAQPNTELGSGSRNPLDRVKRLMELTKEPKIIQWLCQQADGYYVDNPRTDDSAKAEEMVLVTNELVHQFAELLNEITQAALDNTITPDESDRIRHAWDELKRFTERFVKCCEEGDFRDMSIQGLRQNK